MTRCHLPQTHAAVPAVPPYCGTSSSRSRLSFSTALPVYTSGEYTPFAHYGGQVTVMRAGRVARLPRRVDHARRIPVADVHHHAERSAGGRPEIAVAIAGVHRRKHRTADRPRIDVVPLALGGIQNGIHRVREHRRVQLASLPRARVAAELRLHLGHCVLERLVAPSDRTVAIFGR